MLLLACVPLLLAVGAPPAVATPRPLLVSVDDLPIAGRAPESPAERRAPMLGRDDMANDTQVDVMTEEQLLRGLESMTPLEPSANIGSSGGPRERDPRDRGR